MQISLILVFVVMTLLGAVAGLCLKKASGSRNVLGIFYSGYLYLGGLLYMCSMALTIYVLQRLEYSLVVPLSSLTYIWTMLVSRIFLKEKITRRKLGGVGLVLAGVVILMHGM